MELYKKIKELRQLKGLTQRQLAEKIGMAQPNYALVEKGKIKLKLDKVQILAELFGVPAEDLLHLENDTTHQNTITQTQENNNNRVEELEKEIKNLKKENEQLKTENKLLNQLHNHSIRDYENLKEGFENFYLRASDFEAMFNYDWVEDDPKYIEDYITIYLSKNMDYDIKAIKKYNLFGYDKSNERIFYKNALEKLKENYVYSFSGCAKNAKTIEDVQKNILRRYDRVKNIALKEWFLTLAEDILNYEMKNGLQKENKTTE